MWAGKLGGWLAVPFREADISEHKPSGGGRNDMPKWMGLPLGSSSPLPVALRHNTTGSCSVATSPVSHPNSLPAQELNIQCQL